MEEFKSLTMNYERDRFGKFQRQKTNWRTTIIGIIFCSLLVPYIGHYIGDVPETIQGVQAEETTTPPCRMVEEGYYQCTDEETLIEWKEYEEARNNNERNRTYFARVTKYSRKDSCHNPRGDECLTAIGRDTTAHRTLACPRHIRLGTRVRIQGQEYICEDRYAIWVQERFGDTYDIFVEDYDEAVQWGSKRLEVTILD